MFFETKDLYADELTIFDANELHRICSQPTILKFKNDWNMNLEQIKNLISSFLTGYKLRNPKEVPFALAIRTKENKLIGLCGFGPKDVLDDEIEIAYFLDENYTGKGYMSQIIEKAVRYYFEMTNEHYLSALVDDINIASKKILIKNNFTYHDEIDDSGTKKLLFKLRKNS